MCKNESKSLPAGFCHYLNTTVSDVDGKDPEKSTIVSCLIVTRHTKLITDIIVYASVRKIHF